MYFKRLRILLLCIALATPVILTKLTLHALGWEVIQLGSLHTSVITGALFVIGFLLSAVIADYKESERIPAEIASILQTMYEDGLSIHEVHGTFDIKSFQRKLLRISTSIGQDMRTASTKSQTDMHRLSESFADMERAGVPANYIVKLKQQQAQLLRCLLRVAYIQRIRFVPSATVLAQTIASLVIGLLLFTEIEPFYGGLTLTGIITLILLYVLRLIRVISTPFHTEGKTQDDVSLFLIEQTSERLKKRYPGDLSTSGIVTKETK